MMFTLSPNINGPHWFNVRAYGAVGDGVTDDTAAFQAAIAAMPRGSVLKIPDGRYKVTETLGPFLDGCSIIGDAPAVHESRGSWIESYVALSGDPAIEVCHQEDINSQHNFLMSDIGIRGMVNYNVDPWNDLTALALNKFTRPTTPTDNKQYVYKVTTAGTTGPTEPTWPRTLGATVVDGTVTWTCQTESASIEVMGGGVFAFERLTVIGHKYLIVLDGAEHVRISECNLGATGFGGPGYYYVDETPQTFTNTHDDVVAIWFVEGASRGRGFTVPGATNRIKVEACFFNFPAVCVWEEGGAGHIVMDCFANLCTATGVFARIASAQGITYWGNECEGVGLAVFDFAYWTTTTCTNLTLRDNFWASASCPYLLFAASGPRVVCYNLAIDGDVISTSTPAGTVLNWGINTTGAINIRCYYQHPGSRPFANQDLGCSTAIVTVFDTSQTVEERSRLGFGTAQPQAQIDHRTATYLTAARMLRDSNYVHEELWIDAMNKQRLLRRNTSTSTGIQNAGEHVTMELAQTTTADVVTALTVVPNRTTGFVEARIVAQSVVDESLGGVWILQQRVRRANGGNVALIGSLATTVNADSYFDTLTPVLTVDTTTQTVRVALTHQAANQNICWQVKLSLQLACP